MSIGEALAQARREAGLSVADVSRRTRIRETIISGIERDDFSLCGGDFYARGHIRAIARVIGIDSKPLVEEYDAAHLPPDTIPGVHRPPETIPEAHWPPETIGGTHRPIETIPGYEAGEPVTPPEPVAPYEPDDQVTPHEPATPHEPITPHELAMPHEPATWHEPVTPVEPVIAGPPARRSRRRVAHRRRQVNWSVVLGLALLAAIGFGGYLLASGGGTQHETSAASNHRATGHPSARPTPSASPSPAPTHTAAPVHVLNPVNISAFGPGGTSEGDNPQLAPFALDDNAATPWHSDWYTTPRFGNLQPGTGLLLDMGRTVTITAAQIAFGDVTGASIQLRVGGTPALADLPPVAHSTDAGGTVRLRLAAPSRGRYVVIWFTRLPQDQAGTFQASVYSIKLQGST